jgi:hypothetical protein
MLLVGLDIFSVGFLARFPRQEQRHTVFIFRTILFREWDGGTVELKQRASVQLPFISSNLLVSFPFIALQKPYLPFFSIDPLFQKFESIPCT